MTQLPEKTYEALRFLLSLLGVDNEEIKKEVEVFERELQARVAEKLVRKLPEKERKPVAELANKAGEGKATQEELAQKIKQWLNEKEIAQLYIEEGEKFFNEVLREEYEKATDSQKQKIEEMFKKEALKE